VDCRSKKVALFFVACDANPDTRVKIPNVMRINSLTTMGAYSIRLIDLKCHIDFLAGGS